MKTCLLIFGFILYTSLTYSQSAWKPLGLNGGLVSEPASARSEYPSITTDSAGVPYIAYSDITDSLRLMIKKFDGTNWVNVGNLGYHLRGVLSSICISKKDSIYIGYFDVNDSLGRAKVIKFDGVNWVQIGDLIERDSGSYSGLSLAVDSNEKIYFGYGAYSNFWTGPPGKANIFTFDGTDWVPVGNTDFVQYSDRMSLRIGLNNELYVGYNTYYLTGTTPTNSWVQKWNGSQWDTVGTSLYPIYNIDIAPDGTVYAMDNQSNKGVSVKKLVNNTWQTIGNTYVYGYAWQLAINKQGIPHIGHAGAVQRYDGANWYMMANSPFNTFGSSYGGGIAFNKKGLPYVAAQIQTSGANPLIDKIYAWEYDSVITNILSIEKSNGIHIYPNPVKDLLNIEVNNNFATPYRLILTNALGKIIKSSMYSHHSTCLSLQNYPAGVYFLQLADKNGNTATRKLLIE